MQRWEVQRTCFTLTTRRIRSAPKVLSELTHRIALSEMTTVLDEQGWQSAFYYTLSTIAQTLAAAFGILSTFMLYRFQHAETKIEAHEENLSEAVSTMAGDVKSEDLVAQLNEGDGGTVEQVVGGAVNESFGGSGSPAGQEGVKQLHAAGEGISFWSAFHKRALRRLRHALLLTVSTIGFCLVLLCLDPLNRRILPGAHFSQVV